MLASPGQQSTRSGDLPLVQLRSISTVRASCLQGKSREPLYQSAVAPTRLARTSPANCTAAAVAAPDESPFFSRADAEAEAAAAAAAEALASTAIALCTAAETVSTEGAAVLVTVAVVGGEEAVAAAVALAARTEATLAAEIAE